MPDGLQVVFDTFSEGKPCAVVVRTAQGQDLFLLRDDGTVFLEEGAGIIVGAAFRDIWEQFKDAWRKAEAQHRLLRAEVKRMTVYTATLEAKEQGWRSFLNTLRACVRPED